MQNRYRNVIGVFAGLGVLIALILTPTPYHAQGPAQPAQPYRARRTKDGKPDLNGVWQAINSANWDIEGHSAEPGPLWQLGAEFSVPPGLGVVEGGPIPYKPESLQKKKENFADRMNRDAAVPHRRKECTDHRIQVRGIFRGRPLWKTAQGTTQLA